MVGYNKSLAPSPVRIFRYIVAGGVALAGAALPVADMYLRSKVGFWTAIISFGVLFTATIIGARHPLEQWADEKRNSAKEQT